MSPPSSSYNKQHHSRVAKTLKKYNISWDTYKKDPLILFKKDSNFREWFSKHFIHNNKITWYGQEYNLNDHIEYHKDDINVKMWHESRLQAGKLKYIQLIIIYEFIITEKRSDSRNYNGGQDEDPFWENPSKKPRLEDQTEATEGDSNAEGNATEGITEQSASKDSSSVNKASSITTATPQTDTTRGNAANQKGSVSGEAGSRKQQKPQGPIFGAINVSTMPNFKISPRSKTQIWLFKTADWGRQFYNYISLKYPSAEICTFKITKDEIDAKLFYKADKIEFYAEHETIYCILTTLPFSMKWSTWKNKFFKSIEQTRLYGVYSYELMSRVASVDDLSDAEAMKSIICELLLVSLEIEDFGIDIEAEVASEEKRASYDSHGEPSTSKKRKMCSF